MCGVIQTAVLLQTRHHEKVYVVLTDGKRSTSYIISIYDGIKLAPIKRPLPPMSKVTSIYIKALSSRRLQQITPNRANKKETTGKVQQITSSRPHSSLLKATRDESAPISLLLRCYCTNCQTTSRPRGGLSTTTNL